MNNLSSAVKIGEAAKILGVSVKTLRRWEIAGKISSIRTPGGTRLYTLESLQSFKQNSNQPNIINAPSQVDSIGEAAKKLGVSTRTLRRWVESSKLNPLKADNGQVYFARKEIESLLQNTSYDINPSIEQPQVQIEAAPLNPSSTEELLKIVRSDDQIKPEPNLNQFISEVQEPIVKPSLFNKFLLVGAGISALILIITTSLIVSHLTAPKLTAQLLKNSLASPLLSSFNKLAEETVAVINPKKAEELGFISRHPEFISGSTEGIPEQVRNDNSGNVLAVTASPQFLEINADTQINGNLDVRDCINGLNLEATPSASPNPNCTRLTVSQPTTLDQDLSTSSSPTFNTINLSASKDQIVFQSGGPTGTLTWTPSGSDKIATIPDATGEVSLLGQKISNSELDNSSITVSAGTNLSGGGSVALGGSISLALKDSVSLSGTLAVGGATTLSSTLAVSGATTLSSTLSVSGTTTFNGVTYTWPSADGASSTILTTNGAGTLSWGSLGSAAGWTDDGTVVRLTTSTDSVGIGTSVPGSKLGIAGNVGIGVSFANSSAPVNGLAVQGNVGIGTTSPQFNLQVIGDANVTGTLTVGSCTGCLGGSQLLIQDGSASAPGLAFTNDTDTGLWRVGTNLLALTTAGSGSLQSGTTINGLSVNANGNVGIGTTSPVANLHVANGEKITGTFSNVDYTTSTSMLTLEIPGTRTLASSENFRLFNQYNNFILGSNSTLYSNWTENYAKVATGNTATDFYGNYTFVEKDNPSGFAGTLDSLYGTYSQVQNGNGTGTGSTTTSYAGYFINTFNQTSGTDAFGIFARVSPSTTVTNAYSAQITIPSSATNNNIGLLIGNTPTGPVTASLYVASGNSIFRGNVGIGTSANLARNALSVFGGVGIGNSGPNGFSNSTAPSFGLAVQGNVGIGTTSPSFNLDIVGSLRASSTVSFTGLSSGTGNALCRDSSNNVVTCTVGSGGVSGSGFSGGVAFFDSTSNITANPNLFWDNSTSRLGIGTSAPTFQLQTTGNVGIGGSLTVTQHSTLNGLTLNLGSDATGDIFYRSSGGTVSRLPIGNSGEVLGISLGIPNWTTTSSFTAAAGWVDAGAYIRLLTMGDNVGIGTTVAQDPIGKLHIRGNDDATSLAFVTTNNSNSVFGLSVLNNGNVGIGTTSPIEQFHVTGVMPTTSTGSVSTGNSPRSIYVQGRYAYSLNSGDDTLQISDVSNSTTPVSVSTTTTGDHPRSVYVQGRYAYVGNLTSNTLQIFDVSNPSSVVSVGSVSIGSSVRQVYVQGRYAYVVNNSSETLEIIDVSNPSSPLSVGSVSTGAGSGPISVYVQGKYAYVANNSSHTLRIYDVSNPAIPVQTGSVSTGGGSGGPISVYVQGRYAYVANVSSSTLQIFDVSNPASPSSTGSVSTGTSPQSVYVQGRYAYVVSSTAGTLQVYDVSNPASPASAGSVSTGSGTNPLSLYVQGRYAYVIESGNNTLKIFDIGGAYIQQLETGGIETGTLGVRTNLTVFNDTDIKGGLNLGTGGLFSAGSIGIGASTSSVAALRVNQLSTGPAAVFMGGNVGIGTTSPTNFNLQIAGSIGPNTDDTYDLGSSALRWRDLYLGPATLHIGSSLTDEYSLSYDTTNNRLGFNVNDSGPAEIVFDSNGNVGIGTTNPGTLLSVAGNVNIGWTGTMSSAAGPSLGLSVFGNVGIGTTSPAAALQVVGNSIFSGSITVGSCSGCSGAGAVSLPDGSAAAPSLSFTSDSDTGLWRIGTNLLALTTNGAGALQSGASINGLSVNPNGNVGVGTSSPTAALHVIGNCVTGDTKLRRRRKKNGKYFWEEIRIDEIESGDEILTLDERTGEFVPSKVRALRDMGMQDIYEVTTESGKTIRTTAEHPYLAQLNQDPSSKFQVPITHSSEVPGAGWVKVTNLKVGDLIAVAEDNDFKT